MKVWRASCPELERAQHLPRRTDSEGLALLTAAYWNHAPDHVALMVHRARVKGEYTHGQQEKSGRREANDIHHGTHEGAREATPLVDAAVAVASAHGGRLLLDAGGSSIGLVAKGLPRLAPLSLIRKNRIRTRVADNLPQHQTSIFLRDINPRRLPSSSARRLPRRV